MKETGWLHYRVTPSEFVGSLGMTDVRALEARLASDPGSGSSGDFDRLARHYWRQARDESDYRARQKLLKRSSHYVGHAFDLGIESTEDRRLYMDIVRDAARVHTFPQGERRKLARITARWLSSTGADQHRVVARAKGKVALETATFALGDVGLVTPLSDQPSIEGQMVEWMDQGQRLCFGTGYDGLLPCELRMIDGQEPVLAPKEYNKLASSTPTLVLAAPTGQIALADYALLTGPWAERPAWACCGP